MAFWHKGAFLAYSSAAAVGNLIDDTGNETMEDGDLVISNTETTVAFAQALRIYLKAAIGTSHPSTINMPVI